METIEKHALLDGDSIVISWCIQRDSNKGYKAPIQSDKKQMVHGNDQD